MTRQGFMEELEFLLQDIPEEERREALDFYEGYFDEAGPEEEPAIMKELVSPVRVAQRIKAGLAGTPEEDMIYTETGYQDQFDEQEKFQVEPRAAVSRDGQNHRHTKGWEECHEGDGQNSYSQQTDSGSNGEWQKSTETMPEPSDRIERNNRIGRIILIVAVCILCLPMLGSLLGGVISVVAGAFGVLLAIFIVFLVAMVVFVAVGAAMIAGGIATMLADLFNGLLMIGMGMILLGLGLLAGKVFGWFAGTAVPGIFRTISKAWKKLVHGGKETA